MYFLLILIYITGMWVHPIHVSVNEVVVGNETMEWTARIYTDDLLLGLYGKQLDPDALDDGDKTRQDILRYMQKHIRVQLPSGALEWQITDLHPDPEAMWITLSANISGLNARTLQVNTTTLMEVYDDQKNIVNIEAPSSKSTTLIFESGDTDKIVRF